MEIRQKLKSSIVNLSHEACKALLEKTLDRLSDDALGDLLVGSILSSGRKTHREPSQNSIHNLIVTILTGQEEPVRSSDIYRAVKQLKPDVSRGSVSNEIARMRRSGEICNFKYGPRNSCYSLAKIEPDT